MTGKELKIILINDEAFLTENRPLTFEQISISNLVKSLNEPAYLIFKVLKYFEEEKKIFCDIISYNTGKTEFGITQKNLFQELGHIQKVTFKSIDTMQMLAIKKGSAGTSLALNANLSIHKTQALNYRITEKFRIPFKDVLFRNSEISFEYNFKKYRQNVVFNIPNSDIREEFDAIKEYFSNVLKTKNIHVEAEIEIANGIFTPIGVKSPEIDKIDKQLIDEVKLDIIKHTIKKKPDSEKSVFTLEEYFDTFTEGKIKSKVFYANATNFFEDLITIPNTKHYKHLRYLSSVHSHETMKLRIIHKPLSFLFLVKRKSYYHYIWETLDTAEATYIWRIEKNTLVLKETLKNIDCLICQINVEGKNQYLNKKEDSFERIYHDYTKQDDGFEKWKDDLNKILI